MTPTTTPTVADTAPPAVVRTVSKTAIAQNLLLQGLTLTIDRCHADWVRKDGWMSGSIMDVNGVDLCVDTIGDERDPAILLMSGAGASMDWWEDELCQRLAAGGRFAIRYDNRDTGQSVTYPAGAPGYWGADRHNVSRSTIRTASTPWC